MRDREKSRLGRAPLAAALLIPLLLACGADGEGSGDEPASRRQRPAVTREAPEPGLPAPALPADTPGVEMQRQSEAAAPAQPKLAKPTRPRGPAPPAPVRRPFKQNPPQQPLVVKLVPGAPVPESFPRDLPLPSGAQQVAAFDGGRQHSTVAYEVPGPMHEVITELERGYRGAGWEVEVASGQGQALIMAQRSDHIIMADVTPGDDGGTRLEVSSVAGPAAQ